jgi:hypothetical protein
MKFIQSEEKLKMLERMQIKMCEYNAELSYKSRDFSRFQQYIYRENSHNRIRGTWKLIKQLESCSEEPEHLQHSIS